MAKKLRPVDIILRIFKYGIVATGVVLFIVHFVPDMPLTKGWSYLATMGLAFVPDLIRLMGIKISRRLEFWYYVFIVFAMILGIDMDFYQWKFFPYDKVVHLSSGCLAAVASKELIMQVHEHSNEPWFNALFSLCFVALTAVLWECFEFMMDQLFGQHMQELIQPGVGDTMWDMISALMGGLLTITIIHPAKPETRK